MSDTATNPMRDAIQEAISENPVLLFMKGTPDAPACGFSARTVAILQTVGTYWHWSVLPEAWLRNGHSSLRCHDLPVRTSNFGTGKRL